MSSKGFDEARSEALHRRVREFGRAAFELDAVGRAERFDALAFDIHRYQVDAIPGIRRLSERHPAPDSVATIPAVPVEAFRQARIAAHPAELDVACFETSGTSSNQRGRHCFRETTTYRELALRFGRRALLDENAAPPVVVAIAPQQRSASSLGFMMDAFMAEWSAPDISVPSRWLLCDGSVDVDGLRRAVDIAASRGTHMLLLATSFALVYLLDALGEHSLPLPLGSVVMQTGGFKGKTREVPRDELRLNVAQALRIDPLQVVSEYGMTELSSQLYEGTVPGARLVGQSWEYIAPPWLRVSPVDAVTLLPVPDGEVGLARFVDLANVDSALVLVTRDRLRRTPAGVELLGRDPGAVSRGCSLAIEELVQGR